MMTEVHRWVNRWIINEWIKGLGINGWMVDDGWRVRQHFNRI